MDSMNSMELDREPFLTKEEQGLIEVEEAASHSRLRKSNFTSLFSPLALHVLLIVLYTCATVFFIRFSLGKREIECPGRLSVVGGLDLSYRSWTFRNLSDSPYAGIPSPDLDEQWESLLAPMDIRVSGEELQAAGQNSVALLEGGGFMAWLGAYHTLHCINMLRQWVYPEYYHANKTREEKAHLFSHIHHCLEMLRQNSMCRPDLSLTTFKWHPLKEEPMFNASESVHTCVDWDRFTASFSGRVISPEEYARLRNPLVEGEGIRRGI